MNIVGLILDVVWSIWDDFCYNVGDVGLVLIVFSRFLMISESLELSNDMKIIKNGAVLGAVELLVWGRF